MYMSTEIRRKIFRYFFENGVLCVSDNQTAVHPELRVLNIYAFQVGRSFTSKGFAKKSYAWSHAYFTLTDKGIEFLRNFFGLPVEAAPATLRQTETKVLDKRPARRFNDRRGGRPARRDGERPRGGRFQNKPRDAQPSN